MSALVCKGLMLDTLETMQGPVCPWKWRTVFICF